MIPVQLRNAIDDVVAGCRRLVPDGDGWRIADCFRRNPEPPPPEPPLAAARVRKALLAVRKRLEAAEAMVATVPKGKKK